jgi:hypothetical protein
MGIPYSNDPSDIAVNPDTGEILVSGQLSGAKTLDLLQGGLQTSFGSTTDNFVASFTNDLTTWIQSTFVGGSGTEDNSELKFNNGWLYLHTHTKSDDYPGTQYGADPTNDPGANLDFIRDIDGNKLGCCIVVDTTRNDIVVARIHPSLLANNDPTFQVESLDGLKNIDYTINLQTTDRYVLGNITNVYDESLGTVIIHAPDLTHDPDDYNNLVAGLYNVTYSVTDELGLSTTIIETINVNDDQVPTFEVLDMNGNIQTEDFTTNLYSGIQYDAGTIQNVVSDVGTSNNIEYILSNNLPTNLNFERVQLDNGVYYIKYSVTDDRDTTVEIVETLGVYAGQGSSDSGGCDDCIDPTFYYSQGEYIVENGFRYNDYSTDVTNAHTETEPLVTNTITTNYLTLKAYDNFGTNAIKWIDVGFGHTGKKVSFDSAEVRIEIKISDSKIIKQYIFPPDQKLIKFGNATASIVNCGYENYNCLEVTIPHIFRDYLIEKPIIFRAEDESGNTKYHTVNHGIELHGEPHDGYLTDKIFIQKYLGDPNPEWIDILRIDKANGIWISEDGLEFKQNGGGFQRITPLGFNDALID